MEAFSREREIITILVQESEANTIELEQEFKKTEAEMALLIMQSKSTVLLKNATSW